MKRFSLKTQTTLYLKSTAKRNIGLIMVRPMTESNLINAFARESQAHMRYLLYADRATKSSYSNIALLFTAVAYSEKIHAGNHYKNIQNKGDSMTVSGSFFGSMTTSEDLINGIMGENFEINEMYPVYIEVAKAQKEYATEISFKFAWEAEKTHATFFERAKDALDQDNELILEALGVCDICGYAIEGSLPERCPICKAKKDRFSIFS